MLSRLVTYPVWRVLLIFVFSGIWGRISPTYIASDASVRNRFILWKGALQLYAGAFTEGWGWANTGHSYVNWIQSNSDKTEYNGLVNSFLQIGVAFGGVVLALVLAFLMLGLFHSHELTQTKHHIIGSLCLMWTATWIMCSCFSTMLRSSLLVVPVVMSILVTLIVSRPKLRLIVMSLGVAATLSTAMYFAGSVLNASSQFKIVKENGIVNIVNNKGDSNKNCMFYVDECVLGEKYGKEVRRFIEINNIRNCAIIDNINKPNRSKFLDDKNAILVLSGDAVSTTGLDGIKNKLILLYPTSVEHEPNKSEYVKQILFPEIDSLKYRYTWQYGPFWSSKIQLIPYDKPFETTWVDYITDI